MAKKIHLLLSKEAWEDLQKIKRKVGIYDCKSYDMYLKEQKKNPTMALFG